MSTITQTVLPQDLLTMPDGNSFELVDGQLVEQEMGAKAVFVVGEIYAAIRAFVREHSLGWTFTDGAQLRCYPSDPDRIRKPDACFVSRGRFVPDEPPDGFITIAPDLVIEVVSPTDSYYEVDRKVEEYVEAGVRAVWVINPDTRSVKVYGSDREVAHLDEGKELTGGEVLPGFRCPVASLFPTPLTTHHSP